MTSPEDSPEAISEASRDCRSQLLRLREGLKDLVPADISLTGDAQIRKSIQQHWSHLQNRTEVVFVS